MNFLEKLKKQMQQANSLVCVGLDPDIAKIGDQPQFDFNQAIIEATHDLVCAYKPNTAFYEALGAEGIQALKDTCDYLRAQHSDIPIILDAKRADIGNTNNGYAAFAFEYLNVDAITLHPYLGGEALESFLRHEDKGLIILARTSNPGARELQDLVVDGKPLYQQVIGNFVENWNQHGNILFVTGATYPEEIGIIRKQIGDDITLLVPGVGAQGGDLENSLLNGLNQDKEGLIISTSRAVIFASDPRAEALKLRDEINEIREEM